MPVRPANKSSVPAKADETKAERRDKRLGALNRRMEEHGLFVGQELVYLYQQIDMIEDVKDKVSYKLKFFEKFMPYLAPRFKDQDPTVIINNGPTQQNFVSDRVNLGPEQITKVEEALAVLNSSNVVDVDGS